MITSWAKTNNWVGIDLGLKTFAVLSDGSEFEPDVEKMKKLDKQLCREQRRLSRRRLKAEKDKRKLSESKNYQKQRLVVTKIYEDIVNSRNDFLHKLSNYVVKNHDYIVVEDLAVASMMKNHRLARAIGNSAWSKFVSQLDYKCKWYGKNLIKISRWHPSTQLCSSCGHETGPKGYKDLGVRNWTCNNCGDTHDRDKNAAINIMIAGQELRP